MTEADQELRIVLVCRRFFSTCFDLARCDQTATQTVQAAHLAGLRDKMRTMQDPLYVGVFAEQLRMLWARISEVLEDFIARVTIDLSRRLSSRVERLKRSKARSSKHCEMSRILRQSMH